MKRSVFLFPLLITLLLWGCGKYFIPLEGKLEKSAANGLRLLSSDSPNLAVYLEPEMAKKIIMKKADGATCGHAETEIPVGRALSNAIIEGLRMAFPKMIIVDRPERPRDYMLLKIGAEKIEIRFEYSAMARCEVPKMDQGRISVALVTQIINLDNQRVLDETLNFQEEEVDREIPPSSQSGVLEKCLNRIVTKFVKEIKPKIKA